MVPFSLFSSQQFDFFFAWRCFLPGLYVFGGVPVLPFPPSLVTCPSGRSFKDLPCTHPPHHGSHFSAWLDPTRLARSPHPHFPFSFRFYVVRPRKFFGGGPPADSQIYLVPPASFFHCNRFFPFAPTPPVRFPKLPFKYPSLGLLREDGSLFSVVNPFWRFL